MARLIALAAALGILGAIAASAFLEVVSIGQQALFVRLPAALGLSGLPAWFAAVLLLMGAAAVMAARRLPGATGPGPLTGFHFDIPVASAPSVLLAALGTLLFGFVLGPEAPLIVLGSVMGALAIRGRPAEQVQAGRLLGGAASIGAVFGNPFITAFMLLEFAALGMMPARVIPAVLVALGSGYAMQVGVLGLAGLGTHSLAVPGLPAYDTIGVGDLLIGLVVAIAAGALALAVRRAALLIDHHAERRRGLALVAAALATALALWIGQLVGAEPTLVLFSGSTGMAAMVAETSLTVVIVVLATKALAYTVALGSGLRGGPIFPATFLGVAVAIGIFLILGSSTFLGEVPTTPLVAAGIAATAAGMTRLPATSAILGAILVGGSGAAVAPFAILGAIVGLLLREAVERRGSAQPSSA